ncbi:MAG TPA: hypothetical protein VFR32_08440 [Gaiellaceae bacterium]|nr:hypothetical protein [Gaiellaceae bacterium]
MPRSRLRGRLTPSLVISMIALFVSLSSAAYAVEVVPLAVRALSANKADRADTAKVATFAKTANKAKTANTAKLANRAKTADTAKNADTATTAQTANVAVDAQTLGGQTAAQIAATPGPASTIPAAAFRVVSKGWSVQLEDDVTTERAFCNSNEKAVGGGWDQASGLAYVTIDKPLADLSGWHFQIFAESGNTVPANGSVWVVCMRTS